VTNDANGGAGDSDLFRYDSADETWTRLYQEDQYNIGDMELIGVYGDTIVLAETAGLDIAFSSDGGQMFAAPDEEPTDNIISLLLLDDETWWIGDTDGDLWVTDDAGDRSWDEYEIDAVGADITSLAVRGDEAIAGDADSTVYYSEDEGETWDVVGDLEAETAADLATYVCFDSGNDADTVIYAASDDVMGRYLDITDDLDSDWELFTDGGLLVTTDGASGIACLEGVLYVGNAGAQDGVLRVVEPLYDLDDVGESDVDQQVNTGLLAASEFDGGILVTSASPNVIYGIDITRETLWTYTDLIVGPATGLMALPGDFDFTISLDGFDNATDYEFAVYSDEDMRAVYRIFDANTADDEPLLVLADLDVIDIDNADGDDNPATGTEVVDIDAGTQCWVMARAFAPQLLSPTAGAIGMSLKPVFQWGATAGAESYELIVSTDHSFENPIVLKAGDYALPSTAWECDINLNYGTTYYWKVRAINSDTYSAWSAASAFTTESPLLPVGSLAEQSPPQPPTPSPSALPQSTTPDWMKYLLGALLAAVVLLAAIVLVLVRRIR
jgi:hypothetical protein